MKPELSLRIWDWENDPYDAEELAKYWAKIEDKVYYDDRWGCMIDKHDMKPGRGMEIKPDYSFILRVFEAFNAGGEHTAEELFFRTDGEYAPLSLFIICNDLFAWGTADDEPLTPDNIHLLEESFQDLIKLDQPAWFGPALFCCKSRGHRPQKPWFDLMRGEKPPIPGGHATRELSEEALKLFEDCGPEMGE